MLEVIGIPTSTQDDKYLLEKIEQEKQKSNLLNDLKKEDPAETAARKNRIRLGTATIEDFEKEEIITQETKQQEQKILKEMLAKQLEIAENTKNTLFWVRFWSILSIIGFVIALIAIIANL